MQLDTLEVPVRDYINDYIQKIESGYEQRIRELETSIKALKEYEFKYIEIKERYDLLIYKRFCRSAEELPGDRTQKLLFNEEAAQGSENETEEKDEEKAYQTVNTYQRKKAGRKKLDPKLTRKEMVIDLSEKEKTCACGAKLTKIGEETNEKLVIIPQQIYVQKTIRPKYACRFCEGTEDEDKPSVRIAPLAPSIIPKSIASPSLLSTIFTYKYQRHLPYYRQERMYEQIGADISRQDMANWQQQVYHTLQPLFILLEKTVKSGPVVQMDETTVLVVRDGKPKEEDEQAHTNRKKNYMWFACGGPSGKKVIWSEYHPTRAGEHAKTFLKGYCGYLQTDGYEGYEYAVKEMPEIIHVGCFAHVRRKFFEAAQVNKKSVSAQEGITYIRKLYEIESELRKKLEKDNDIKSFLIDRKAKAEVILEKFKAWLERRKDEVPPSMLLGIAVNYTLRQWSKLSKYLESPDLTPDNNLCENAIRPFVLSRKNFLFHQSSGGAKSSCGIYTLIETAKQNGIVPYDYLMALFEKAPLASSAEDWEKLLPWNIFTP